MDKKEVALKLQMILEEMETVRKMQMKEHAEENRPFFIATFDFDGNELETIRAAVELLKEAGEA